MAVRADSYKGLGPAQKFLLELSVTALSEDSGLPAHSAEFHIGPLY